jgi:hypothetical protein
LTDAAFFVPDGAGRFRGTAHTIGPWSTDAMHFGPPAALLGRAVEALPAPVPMRVARITFEILRPVPVSPVLEVTADLVRPGKRVALAEARLTAEGQDVALARAWLMRTTDLEIPEAAREGPPTPGPDTAGPAQFFPHPLDVHYGSTMEVRFISGQFLDLGPAVAWFRAPIPLVSGEDLTPLQRVLVAADSGNGISAVAAPADLIFVNTDLTVHLHRYPVGEWVCMNARTTLDPSGIGLADTVLSDETGRIGRSVQSLYVAPARSVTKS